MHSAISQPCEHWRKRTNEPTSRPRGAIQSKTCKHFVQCDPAAAAAAIPHTTTTSTLGHGLIVHVHRTRSTHEALGSAHSDGKRHGSVNCLMTCSMCFFYSMCGCAADNGCRRRIDSTAMARCFFCVSATSTIAVLLPPTPTTSCVVIVLGVFFVLAGC